MDIARQHRNQPAWPPASGHQNQECGGAGGVFLGPAGEGEGEKRGGQILQATNWLCHWCRQRVSYPVKTFPSCAYQQVLGKEGLHPACHFVGVQSHNGTRIDDCYAKLFFRMKEKDTTGRAVSP